MEYHPQVQLLLVLVQEQVAAAWEELCTEAALVVVAGAEAVGGLEVAVAAAVAEASLVMAAPGRRLREHRHLAA